MSRKLPPKNYDENPEWTKADFAKAKKPQDTLSAATLKNFRGPQKEPTKVPVSIRLNQAVVDHFKAQGPGWQTKIDEVLTVYATREEALRAAKGASEARLYRKDHAQPNRKNHRALGPFAKSQGWLKAFPPTRSLSGLTLYTMIEAGTAAEPDSSGFGYYAVRSTLPVAKFGACGMSRG